VVLIGHYEKTIQEKEEDSEALKVGKITELGSKEGDRVVTLRFDHEAEALVLNSKGTTPSNVMLGN
jgi:hypothetical protein